MKNDKLTYTDAFKQLQTIVTKLEKADISVDELEENLQRASELINICKDILTKTEKQVENIIEEK